MIRLLAGAMLATMTLYPLGATASMTPHNETPRALTALDLVNLKRVSDPRISPAGKSVASTLRPPDYDANNGITQIWLLDLATQASRLLYSRVTYSSNERWSSEGPAR